MIKYLLIFCCFLIIFSCKQGQNNQKDQDNQPDSSLSSEMSADSDTISINVILNESDQLLSRFVRDSTNYELRGKVNGTAEGSEISITSFTELVERKFLSDNTTVDTQINAMSFITPIVRNDGSSISDLIFDITGENCQDCPRRPSKPPGNGIVSGEDDSDTDPNDDPDITLDKCKDCNTYIKR